MLAIDSKSPILNNPKYTKVLSPLSSNKNTPTQYIIAFTKNGYTESNTPLQSLKW